MPVTRIIKRLFLVALTLPALTMAQRVYAQSFDCHQAETDTEWAICNTPDLSTLDTQTTAAYNQLVTAATKAGAPQFRKDMEQTHAYWVHQQRDLCEGDVGCLTKAYQSELSTLKGMLPVVPVKAEQEQAAKRNMTLNITPSCGIQNAINTSREIIPVGSQPDLTRPRPLGYVQPKILPDRVQPISATFAKIVCGRPDLLQATREIDTVSRELRSRLAPVWRKTFDTQQAAFSNTPYGCDLRTSPTKPVCVAQTVQQRLQDVKDLAASLSQALPACKPSEIVLKPSNVGDAGMSHTIDVYLLEYRGKASCQIRGYPSITFSGPKKMTALYSGSTYFSRVATPPLPVPLSAHNRTAWFAISSADACDPGITTGTTLKIALPLSQTSQTALFTHQYGGGTDSTLCPEITVSPVSALSTMLSSIY